MTRPDDRPIRTGVVIGAPNQHFSPAFRALAAQSRIESRVYYWHDAIGGQHDPGFGRHVEWSVDLHSGYDWWAPPARLDTRRRAAATWARLRADRPDVLVCFGWATPNARVALAYAVTGRTPVLLYGDTNPQYASGTRWTGPRRWILRTLFRRCAGAVASGGQNRRFYLEHGMPAARVHPGICPTLVDDFAAARTRRSPRDAPVTIGFAGKFVAHKAVHDLISAVARLDPELPWELRLIGDGPERDRLVALADRLGITPRVHFLGFRNTDQLPALMADLDVLVLPSRKDNRGLVAVEAMAAGAVPVVSDACGVWADDDVLRPGETGLVFPTGDVDALAARLHTLVTEPDLRHRLATAGAAVASTQGPERFAAHVAHAVRATAGLPETVAVPR